MGLGFRGDLFFVDEAPVLWARLRVMANVLTFQFSPFVLIVVLAGLILLFRRDRLLAAVLAASLGVHTLVAAVYRAPQTVEYMLPVYVLLAFLYGIAGGYFRHVTAFSRQVDLRGKLKSVTAVLALVAMMMAVVHPGRRKLPQFPMAEPGQNRQGICSAAFGRRSGRQPHPGRLALGHAFVVICRR